MLNQEFMNTLSPVELQFFQSYAYKLIQEKVTAETQNYENMIFIICFLLSLPAECSPMMRLHHSVFLHQSDFH